MLYRSDDILYAGNYPYPVKIERIGEKFKGLDYFRFCLIDKEGSIKSSFYLNEVSACCGALFLSAVYAYSRGGWGRKALEVAVKAARLGGYSVIYCILAGEPRLGPDNRMRRFFEKAGFKKQGSSIKNTRSDNYLYHYQLDINDFNKETI